MGWALVGVRFMIPRGIDDYTTMDMRRKLFFSRDLSFHCIRTCVFQDRSMKDRDISMHNRAEYAA